MKETIFSLNPGDKFLFHGKVFKVLKYKYKVMPRLGRMFHAFCWNEDENKPANFTMDFEVQLTNRESPKVSNRIVQSGQGNGGEGK